MDPDATIDTKLRVGSTVTLRRTSHGTYEQPGLPASCGWLALTQLGLFTGLLSLLAARNRHGTRRTPRPLRLVIATVATTTLVSALVGEWWGWLGLCETGAAQRFGRWATTKRRSSPIASH